MKRVYIGLGSNLGDRAANLEKAVELISAGAGVVLRAKSGVEETDPVDYLEQPGFLNQVVCVETALEPYDLLALLHEVENSLGRSRRIPKGPRTMDCDILLYGDEIIDSATLTVPHPGITGRWFVMKHLLEIDPDLVNPATKIPYREVFHEKNKKHQ